MRAAGTAFCPPISVGEPPASIVQHAVRMALQSPCRKSRRGAVVFWDRDPPVIAAACNGQPLSLVCPRGGCGDRCGKLAIHAEDRAIRIAIGQLAERYGELWATARVAALRGHGVPATIDQAQDVDILHAKIGDTGQLVPGGGPSCWQCSRTIYDVGIRSVWLYEIDGAPEDLCGQTDRGWTTAAARACRRGRGHDGLCHPLGGVWRRYRADRFHELTAAAAGLAPLTYDPT